MAQGSKNKGGRPKIEFKEEYCKQVEKLCKLGATDKELAGFFEVSLRTLQYWKKEYPQFLHSLKSGKMIADADVAQRLYERAMGYEHAETKFFHHQGKIVSVETTTYYPPDTTAAIFWLKNRQPENWRDKKEISGDPHAPLVVKQVAFEDVTPEDEE